MNDRTILDKVLEAGIYLSVASMLLAKGEGVTDIFIFGSLVLWLFAPRYRWEFLNMKGAVPALFFITIGVISLSVIFSIDPQYSFREMMKEPLKAAVFLPLVATVMADEARLKRLLVVMAGAAAIVVLIAFYTYISQGERASPNTFLFHAQPNRFSKHLNIFLSFIVVLYFIWKGIGARVTLTLFLLGSVLAILLSGSRGGFGSALVIASVWGIYLWRKEGLSIIAMLSAATIIIISIGMLSWSSPYVRNKIDTFPEHVRTMTGRTSFWESAFYAFKERPVFGWGYGKKIFNMEEPYKKSGSKIPPLHPHNTFVKILFHQGIVGFIPYILLLILSVIYFWRDSLKSSGIKSHVSCACVAAIVGIFFLQSMLEILRLHYLAMILGIGLASAKLPAWSEKT